MAFAVEKTAFADANGALAIANAAFTVALETFSNANDPFALAKLLVLASLRKVQQLHTMGLSAYVTITYDVVSVLPKNAC